MEPRPHERGKERAHEAGSQVETASMEPRPHERGKCNGTTQKGARNDGFNGATSSRTWKGQSNPFDEDGFWPASMEPRPHERGKSSETEEMYEPFALQWSHVLTNVESG